MRYWLRRYKFGAETDEENTFAAIGPVGDLCTFTPLYDRTVMKYIIFIASISAFCQVWGQAPDAARIRQHIRVLASDSLLGRGSGTSGEVMAASYIENHFKALKLTPKGEQGYYQSFPFKGGAHGTGREGVARNIIGFIDNKAPSTIVIGAHYDHLGLGHDGNSLDANAQDKIHNGADDNASGVAGVLELARYYQTNKVKEKNNFLFICFSAEELGLYGSKYFTEHPTVPLTSINFMINLDMIGRYETAKGLSVSGTGTTALWEPILKETAGTLLVKTDSSGMGPSDHASFYLKSVSALHFFTGSHTDYHKPSDDWEKINFEGEREVLNLIIRVIEKAEAQPKVTFLATKNRSLGAARAFKVTMGVMPSYTADAEGLVVDGVTEGKPAQKGGIQAGDVIIQMGDIPVKGMQSYMEALGKFNKGETIDVKIKRAGEEKILKVTF